MSKAPSKSLNNGTKIPIIGLGTFGASVTEIEQVTYDALDVGYRLFDSAEYYQNEEGVTRGIARWLRDNEATNKRSDIYYTTKISEGFKEGYAAVKKSIDERLRLAEPIGYIDLLLIHAPLTSKQYRLETWKALQEAVEEGKVKSIGVSNYGQHHLEELFAWEGLKIKPVVNQIELNPWLCRTDLVKFCRSTDIEVEAYSPLMRGQANDQALLVNLAKKYNKNVAQILIKWSLQQGFIVIPKTSQKERLSLNFNVFDFELTEEEINELTHPNDNWVVCTWSQDPITYRDNE